MQTSPTPTTSPRTRQRYVDDAYNEREHAVLKMLREKHPEDDVYSVEDLAKRSGLSVDDADRTLKVLMKRHVVSIVALDDDDRRSPVVIKASRVEDTRF